MKRAGDVDGEGSPDVRKEEILDRTRNEYEAIVAIAKEARRLNAVPGVFLEKGEGAIPRAVENFVDGKVDYVVEGGEFEKCDSEAGRKGKRTRSSPGKKAGKAAKKSGKKR